MGEYMLFNTFFWYDSFLVWFYILVWWAKDYKKNEYQNLILAADRKKFYDHKQKNDYGYVKHLFARYNGVLSTYLVLSPHAE